MAYVDSLVGSEERGVPRDNLDLLSPGVLLLRELRSISLVILSCRDGEHITQHERKENKTKDEKEGDALTLETDI